MGSSLLENFQEATETTVVTFGGQCWTMISTGLFIGAAGFIAYKYFYQPRKDAIKAGVAAGASRFRAGATSAAGRVAGVASAAGSRLKAGASGLASRFRGSSA